MKPLEGLEVVVTRPRPEGEKLAQAIRRAGGTPLLAPLIDIELLKPKLDPPRGDLWIYVSRNAVRSASSLGCLPPEEAKVIAMGPGTAEELGACRLRVDATAPPPYTSERLLELAELQDIAGKEVVLVCGQGGRDLLCKGLADRGARVVRLEVYRRSPRSESLARLRPWLEARRRVVVVTSGEILDMLSRAVPKAVPLVVISPRLAEKARKLGFQEILQAASVREEDLIAALSSWWSVHGHAL